MAILTVNPTTITVTDVNQDNVTVNFECDKTLTDIKLSMDGGNTYRDKLNMTQTSAIFDISGISNDNYNCKLKGYYEDIIEYEFKVMSGTYTGEKNHIVYINGTCTYPNVKYWEVSSPDGWIGVANYHRDGKFELELPSFLAVKTYNNCVMEARAADDTVIAVADNTFTLVVQEEGSAVIPVNGISLDTNSYTFTSLTTKQLNATISPANATNKNITWFSSNASVATVNNTGMVTAKSNGSCQITVTTEDSGFTANCNIFVNVQVEPPPESDKNTYRQVAYIIKPWEGLTHTLNGIEMFKDLNYGSVLLCLPVDNSFDNNQPFTQVTESMLDAVISKCNEYGLEVTLKMHNIGTAEDGTGNYDAPTNPSTWFSNYKTLVQKFCGFANRYGYDKLIISNEMNKVMNIAAWRSYFLPCIQAVKDAGLKCGMSANLPELIDENKYQYFNEMDFYTINAYPQLTKNSISWARENHQALKDAFYVAEPWSWYDADYGDLIANLGGSGNLHKDVWITEIGCMPNVNGLWAPAYWGGDAEYNEEVQKLYLDAMLDVLENDQKAGKLSTRLKKYTLWDGQADSNYNPMNKMAKEVMEKWWNFDEGGNVDVPVTGVSLDETSYTFTTLGTIKLNATVSPDEATDKSVYWSSINSSVASVDQNGNVTALKNGTTTISVMTYDGNKKASCNITVNANTVVEEITVNSGVYYCKPGDSFVNIQGSSTLTNAHEYEAISDNGQWAGMATYDGTKFILETGWILWEGEYLNLRMRAKNSSGQVITSSDKTFDLIVTNTPPSGGNVNVTGVKLNNTSHIFTDDTSLQLVPTVSPSDATNKTVEFTSTNTNVAIVSQGGLVIPKSNGSCQIKCTTIDGGFLATCNVQVNIAETPTDEKNHFEIGNSSLQSNFRSSHVADVENNKVIVTSPNEGGVDGYAIWQLPNIKEGRTYRVTCTTNDTRNFVRIRVDGVNLITKDRANSYEFEFTGQDAKSKVIELNIGIRYREGYINPIIVDFSDIKIVDINGEPDEGEGDGITYDVVDYKIIVSDGVNTESYHSCDDIPRNHPTLGGGVDGYKIVIKNGIKHYLSLTKGTSDSKITINGMKPFNYSVIDQDFKNTWSNRGHAIYKNSLKYTVANRLDNNEYGITDDRLISQESLDRALYIYNCAIPGYMEITQDQNSVNSVSEAHFDDSFLGICRLYNGQKFHVHQNVRLLGGFGNSTRFYVAVLVHEFGHTTGIWDHSPHYPTTYTYNKNQENEWLQPSDIAHIKDKFPHLTGVSETKTKTNNVSLTENNESIAFTFYQFENEEEMEKLADRVVESRYVEECGEIEKYGIVYKLYNFEDIQIKVPKSIELDVKVGEKYRLFVLDFENTQSSLLNPNQTIIKI